MIDYMLAAGIDPLMAVILLSAGVGWCLCYIWIGGS